MRPRSSRFTLTYMRCATDENTTDLGSSPHSTKERHLPFGTMAFETREMMAMGALQNSLSKVPLPLSHSVLSHSLFPFKDRRYGTLYRNRKK